MNSLSKASSLALVIAAMLLGACATPPKVRVDKDSSTNFASYKTFSLLTIPKAPPPAEPKPIPGTEGAPAAPEVNTLADNRVRNAVVAALQAKGYTLTEANPDFRVSYSLNVYEKQKDSGMRIGLGAGGGSGHVGGGVGLSIPVGKTKNMMGTMTIDIVDAARNAQVWTGSYEQKVEAEGVSDETANKIVSTILARFPNDPPKK
jgi:hypothetical protein